MKNLFYLICILILFSCTSGIEKKAKKQMALMIKEQAIDPNIQINDIKVLFQTDSVVIIHCTTRGINGFGGYSRNEMEYLYAICDNGNVMENLSDKDKHLDVHEYTLRQLKSFREFNAKHCDNPTDTVALFLEKIGYNPHKDSVSLFKDNILTELKLYGRIVNN